MDSELKRRLMQPLSISTPFELHKIMHAARFCHTDSVIVDKEKRCHRISLFAVSEKLVLLILHTRSNLLILILVNVFLIALFAC